jgi:hypothetical protein
MKKIFLSFLLSAITAGFAFSQKTINDPNAEKRAVGSFHGIKVETGIELTLTEGNTEEVAVSAATTEFRDRIITKVENGILKIFYESKMGAINKRKESKYLKAYVSYKTLDLLHANTGAEVEIVGVLKTSSLDIDANTGALIKGELDVNALKVVQNTGSKLTLSGRADKMEIGGDTGSIFVGEDLATMNCNIKVNTGAKVTVKAEKELQVKASTGGIVKYKGNATIREIKTNTGGSVSKI